MLDLQTEAWVWYGVAFVVILTRMISRRIVLGSFKRYEIDDYLVIVSMATHAVFITLLTMIQNMPNNLMEPDDYLPFPPDEIEERVYASKAIFVIEQMQCATIWIIKTCILLMYSRLTLNTTHGNIVKIVAVYTAGGFIIMEILLFAVWCRPFSDYWAIPPNNVQCATYENHLITNAVVNLSSDLMIIAIPFPLFFRSSLELKQKVTLSGVFALGIFTVISAILSKYYSFVHPFSSGWMFWYVRESSTAIITANLPPIWPLIRKVFRIKATNAKANCKGLSSRTSNFEA